MQSLLATVAPRATGLWVSSGGGQVVVDGGATDAHGVGDFVDGVAKVKDTTFGKQPGGTLFVEAGKVAQLSTNGSLDFGDGDIEGIGEVPAVLCVGPHAAYAATIPVKRHIGHPHSFNGNKGTSERSQDWTKHAQQLVILGLFDDRLHTDVESGCARRKGSGRKECEYSVDGLMSALDRGAKRAILGFESGVSDSLYGGENVRARAALTERLNRELEAQTGHHPLP